MEIYPPIEQRFSPFNFYLSMRKNNPIVFDEEILNLTQPLTE